MDENELTRDEHSGLEIRKTDNGLKDCDLQAEQTPSLLELDDRGLPVGWEVPNGNA